MNILWYSNVLLPAAAEAANISGGANSAGWIEGFLQRIKKIPQINIGILCKTPRGGQELQVVEKDTVIYYITPYQQTSEMFRQIIGQFQPDILHVFGTESEQALLLIQTFGRADRTVINIQGMMGIYGDLYLEGLPDSYRMHPRFFERIIGNSLLDQQENFYRRSQIEQKALNSVEHVIGRTDIDRMVSLTANPHLHYHFCNEILRDEFYTGEKWDPEQIEEYSIMVRSTGNPLKGLHMMLKAMPPILERFPKAVLHVVGNNIFYPTTAKARFVEGSYNKLCRKLLEKYRLKDHIAFLGSLNATEMCKQYLRANVVVSASIIENESNVVSEAKILGVPVVSSYVGGLPNRITHGIDGFLYPFNLPEMLAYYVKEIFSDADLARSISKNAIRTQAHTNDPDRNSSRLFEIYKSMIK